MEVRVECDCGKELSIEAITTGSNSIWIIVEKCETCSQENYDNGEHDGKAIERC
jgi:hypothetical protein